MTGKIGKRTNRGPDQVGAVAQDERESQWGEIDGKILNFYPDSQTADIQPLYRPTFDGKQVDAPVLYDVQINFPRAGHGAITSPIQSGDKVRLSPKMRSSENYHSDDDGSAGGWKRSFHLSDMEATITGGNSLTDPIKNFDSNNTHIRANEDGSHGIRMSQDGKLAIEGAEGNVYTMIAEFMELVANDKLNINYGSSAGTGHALENKDRLLALASNVRAMAL